MFGTSDSIVMITRRGQKRIWRNSALECRPSMLTNGLLLRGSFTNEAGAKRFASFVRDADTQGFLSRLRGVGLVKRDLGVYRVFLYCSLLL